MRVLELERVPNARDLGGIAAGDGRVVKSGLLYRGCALADATDHDKDVLFNDLGISCVIDLRCGWELEAKPDHLPDGVEYLHIPFYDLEKVPAYGAHFVEYQLTPSEPKDAYIGTVRDKAVTYSVSDATFSMEFTNETYAGLKEMLKAVYADRYAKNFNYIRLRYNNVTGVVRGEITLHAFSVTDRGTLGQGDETNFRDPYPEVMIPQVKMGVECVFGPTVTPVPTLELENPEE